MELSSLIKVLDKDKKRVGRGYGSGKAKTSGRGTKGQKARSKTRAGFEGGQLPLIKRLPFRRGLGNTSHKRQALAINAARLTLPEGSKITPDMLKEAGLVPLAYNGAIKVIGLPKDTTYTFEGVLLTRVAAERLNG